MKISQIESTLSAIKKLNSIINLRDTMVYADTLADINAQIDRTEFEIDVSKN